MSADDIRKCLLTSYRPFAYWVPSETPWILRNKKGAHPDIDIIYDHLLIND